MEKLWDLEPKTINWPLEINKFYDKFPSCNCSYRNGALLPSLRSILRSNLMRHPELIAFTYDLPREDIIACIMNAFALKQLTEAAFRAAMVVMPQVDVSRAGSSLSPNWLNISFSFPNIRYVQLYNITILRRLY